jgi:hypothetical protein
VEFIAAKPEERALFMIHKRVLTLWIYGTIKIAQKFNRR